ncbi:MarR family EPS-associated transcriptional regulator [Elongatibacter sediminis]|uniref:MarR family EPS-associated transcriptional regulator n=1 Tax=Elongatibacter sediminis TaxID=3119006 RepID=A0AAW9R765_9GAMM
MSRPGTGPSQEIHLQVLRTIEARPDVTQRQLAQELGVSLGKTNYCLRALIDRGWVKANNFKNSNNKAAYTYLLTPKGMEEKAKITMKFLRKKMAEYEQLRAEIEDLGREVKRTHGGEHMTDSRHE